MKKISTNTVKAFLKENKQDNAVIDTYDIGDSTFDVSFKTSLTIDEQSIFVNRVLSGCFDAAGNYRPEYFEPMCHATILQLCTNVPVITLKGEQSEGGAALMDIDAMESLWHALGFNRIENYDDSQTMNPKILRAIWMLRGLAVEAVEWKRSKILSAAQSANTEAINAVGEAAQSVRDMMQALTDKIEKLDMSELLTYAKTLSSATQGLDEGGILKGLLQMQKA